MSQHTFLESEQQKPEVEMKEDVSERIAGKRIGSIEGGTALTYDENASFTPAEERAFVKKLDRLILPWVMLLYMLSYLDRSNLGNAVPLGIKTDLKLVGTEYEWAGALFYCATFTFGTVGGLMLKVVPPRMWLAGCLFGWGAMAAAQAGTHNFAGLGACRFFLGVFEASFAPGCAFYLSFWYLKDELTLRIAAYAGTSALAGVIGGLVSYGCGFYKGPLKSWQLLFIIEGVPTSCLAFIVFFVLPDRPEVRRSRLFNADEQNIAMARRTRYVKLDTKSGISWVQVKEAFVDYRLWLFAIIYSGLSLSLGVISIFLPTLINTMGFLTYKANLMTVPLYAVGYFGLIAIAWASGKYRQRAIPIAVSSAIGGTGYLLLGLCKTAGPRLVGAFFIVAGTYWSFPVVLAWVSNTFASDSKGATGLGVVIAVTHAVGIAAAHIFPSTDSPQYFMGSIVSACLMFLSTVGSLLMRFLLDRENKRRDREYGIAVGEPIEMGKEADKNTAFRYIL